MDTVFLEGTNHLLNDVLSQLHSYIKVLEFWVMTPRTFDWASGHKYRCPDARPIGQVIVEYSSNSHEMLTSVPCVCLTRL